MKHLGFLIYFSKQIWQLSIQGYLSKVYSKAGSFESEFPLLFGVSLAGNGNVHNENFLHEAIYILEIGQFQVFLLISGLLRMNLHLLQKVKV